MTVIETKLDGPIAEITLNGPGTRNALDANNLRALREAVAAVADQAELGKVRVLVLSGKGEVFCAGRDIAEVDVETDDAYRFLTRDFGQVFEAIRALRIPVLAVVQGAALGLGFGLAAACDLVFAAEDAKFGSPFARIGAVLDSGAHSYFVSALGYHRTMDLVLTGRMITGAEAAACGLVSRALPVEELTTEAIAVAERLATGPVKAFAMEKALTQQVFDDAFGLEAALNEEAALQEAARLTADYREGFRAFQEHRKPTFTGE